MPSIFPEIADGGVVIRDGALNCYTPPNAQNYYCPPVTFSTTGNVTVLADGCASINVPAQINATRSELLCLAATLDPNGNWASNSVCNLSAAFTNWTTSGYITALASAVCTRPPRTWAQVAAMPNPRHLICDGSGNIFLAPADPAMVAATAPITVNLSLSGTGQRTYTVGVNYATDTQPGVVSLAVAANYPSTSNTEAVTPAYLNAALAAVTTICPQIAALPIGTSIGG